MNRPERDLRLGVVLPGWSPMRHVLLETAARQPGVCLTVFFERETLDDRPTWSLPAHTAYDWVNVKSLRVPGSSRLIPVRLPKAAATCRLDALVVVCLTQAFSVLPVLGPTRLILWTGENSRVLSRKPVPGLMKDLRRLFYPCLDGFACYSRTTRAYVSRRYSIAGERLFLLPQCIDNRHFAVSPAVSGEKARFLCVGRLVPGKGLRRLVAAWHCLGPDLRSRACLVLAGDGPLRSELESLSRQPGSDIRFPGFVSYASLPALYARAQVLIHPSLEDNWGFVINEAMAAGLPILCSIHAGAREMVRPGFSGMLFDPSDPLAVARAITTIWRRREAWSRMGALGRSLVAAQGPGTSARALVSGIRRIMALPSRRKG